MRRLAPRPLAALLLLAAVACRMPPRAPAALPVEHAPAAGPPAATGEVLAVIGDFGVGTEDEAAVAGLVASWSPAAVLTVGDNNYEHGEAATLDDHVGAFYHAFIAFGPTYRGRFAGQGSEVQRFFPVLGNHDWRAAGARPHLAYYDLPGNGRYYRQRLGDVELFALDSDPHEPDGIDAHSAQATWLRGALADSGAAFRIVTLHHPPFSSGPHGDNQVMQWPFAEWGVDAVMGGHDHHYERLERGGVTYLVLGTGGARLRAATPRPREGAGAHVLYHERHGAVRLVASPERLAVDFVDVDRRRVDSVVLPARPRPGSPT